MPFKSLTAPFASDYLEPILDQLSEAVTSAAEGDQTQRGFIPHALRDLAKLEVRPACLTDFAYEWCSAIYGNRENFEDWETLLLACLETGFRHLDPWRWFTDISLTHTEHHPGLADVVFKSQKTEAIADLIHTWILDDNFSDLEATLVDICTGRLVGLHNLVQFSPRLRRLVILFIERVSYEGFRGVGVEKFVELLDHLHVTVEDMDRKHSWTSLLLDVIRSPEGTQHLPHWCWELLVELAVSGPWLLDPEDVNCLEITKSLTEAQEWGKLECWIGSVGMLPELPDFVGVAEEDLESSMLLLFRQRPGAAQKIERWTKQWSRQCGMGIPEWFERSFKRAHEAAQGQVVL